jgi:hypothetical protein
VVSLGENKHGVGTISLAVNILQDPSSTCSQNIPTRQLVGDNLYIEPSSKQISLMGYCVRRREAGCTGKERRSLPKSVWEIIDKHTSARLELLPSRTNPIVEATNQRSSGLVQSFTSKNPLSLVARTERHDRIREREFPSPPPKLTRWMHTKQARPKQTRRTGIRHENDAVIPREPPPHTHASDVCGTGFLNIAPYLGVRTRNVFGDLFVKTYLL